MALEDYIEKVTDEIEELEKEQEKNNGDDKMTSLNDFMTEFGIEKGEKSTDVLSILRSSGAVIPEHYVEIMLKECYNDDIKEGKPYLSQITEKEFEDKETGRKTTKYETSLVIVDDEHDETVIIPMNINPKNIIDKDNEIIKNVHVKSKLFRLVDGIAYLKTGERNNFGGSDSLSKCNFGAIRKYVNSLPRMVLTIKEVRTVIDNEEMSYNTFVVENPDDY